MSKVYAISDQSYYNYVYQYKDHLGNVRLNYGFDPVDGEIEIIDEHHYYPFGLEHTYYNTTTKDFKLKETSSGSGFITKIEQVANSGYQYKYNGKELQDELGLNLYDFDLRHYDPAIGRWLTVDPLAEQREWLSPYNFVQNNPIMRIDPDGALDEPVYCSDGTYRGDKKEGFIGEVIIYDGKEDISKMSKNELLSKKGADTYDNQRGSLTGDAKSDIWTHIASQLEGQQIYDETFSMGDLTGGKIHFDYDKKPKGSWVSSYILGKGKIRGSDKYSYSTTVENIQSSIVVHEFYSHIKKNNGDGFDSHRLAYKNVINYKSLWNKTTDGYKGFNMRGLRRYTIDEANGKKTQVDPLYRNLYKKYHKKYD